MCGLSGSAGGGGWCCRQNDLGHTGVPRAPSDMRARPCVGHDVITDLPVRDAGYIVIGTGRGRLRHGAGGAARRAGGSGGWRQQLPRGARLTDCAQRCGRANFAGRPGAFVDVGDAGSGYFRAGGIRGDRRSHLGARPGEVNAEFVGARAAQRSHLTLLRRGSGSGNPNRPCPGGRGRRLRRRDRKCQKRDRSEGVCRNQDLAFHLDLPVVIERLGARHAIWLAS